jgi:amidase
LAGDLAAAGCHVEERDPGACGFDVGAARDVLNTITYAEWSASGWGDLDPSADDDPPTLREYVAALTRRDTLIAAFQGLFAEFDAFICPVAAVPAIPHCPKGTPIDIDGRAYPYYQAISAHTGPLSLTGCPIAVVPAGRSREGLPIGVQIVGPRWGEARVLAVARLIEGVTGGFQWPPGY